MNLKKSWKESRSAICACVILLVFHFILKEMLSRCDVVSCIFAAGFHVPLWMLATTAGFILIRLATFLLVPAIIAWKISTIVLNRLVWKETE